MIKLFTFVSIFCLAPGYSLAQISCSSIFMQIPSIAERLDKQFRIAKERKKVRAGAINLSGKFRTWSRDLNLTFEGQEEVNFLVYGRSYKVGNIEYVDIARSDESPVLERIPFQDLFEAAKRSSFYLEVEKAFLNSRVLLPSRRHEGARGKTKLDFYRFSRWLKNDHEELDVISLFGERRRVTLEEVFRASLATNKSALVEVENFLARGGRGEIFYSEAEIDPTYHGIAILLSKWPAIDPQATLVAFREREIKDTIERIISRGLPVVYFFDSMPFQAAAGSEMLTGRSIHNRLSFPHETTNFLLLTRNLTLDTIVHENTHLRDGMSGLSKQLEKQNKALLYKYKAQARVRNILNHLELALYFTYKVIVEHRAYTEEIQFLRDRRAENLAGAEERIQRAFFQLYAQPFNEHLAVIKNVFPELYEILARSVREHRHPVNILQFDIP